MKRDLSVGRSSRPGLGAMAGGLLAFAMSLGLTSDALAGGKGRPFSLVSTGLVNQSNFSLFVSGNATHLGRFTAVGQITANVPAPGHPGYFLRSGYLLFTAANGDTLAMSFENAVVNGSTGLALGLFEVDGGTGRFADASGVLPFLVTQDSITSPTFQLIAVGLLDY